MFYRFYRLFGTLESLDNLVRFRCLGHVNYTLRKRDSSLRQADFFKGLHASSGNGYRIWIGKSDVFTGVNHYPASDKHRITARLYKSLRPIQGGVAVASPHALYKRGNHVVIHILGHAQGFLLYRLLRFLFSNSDNAVLIRVRGKTRKFERV